MGWLSLVLSVLELGLYGDQMSSVVRASNGDILVAGTIIVEENDDFQPSWWHADTYIARLTPDAKSVIWEKSYGWTQDDHAYAVGEYADGTIQVVGDTWSTGNGMSDAYFMLLDSSGELIWEQDFGGFGIDTMEAFALLMNRIVAVGTSASYGGTLEGLPWAMCVDQDGEQVWNTVVGQQDTGAFHDVVLTRGGVVAVGEIDISPDLEESDSAVRHILVVQFSTQGILLWEKHHLLGFNPQARVIVRLSDGGFLIAGSTQKSPQDSRDGFILRLKKDGSMNGFKIYGGQEDDGFNDLVFLPKNRVMAIGSTNSYGVGLDDMWFLGTSLSGQVFLNKTFGTPTDVEIGSSIVRLPDNSFAFSGSQFVGRFTLTNP